MAEIGRGSQPGTHGGSARAQDRVRAAADGRPTQPLKAPTTSMDKGRAEARMRLAERMAEIANKTAAAERAAPTAPQAMPVAQPAAQQAPQPPKAAAPSAPATAKPANIKAAPAKAAPAKAAPAKPTPAPQKSASLLDTLIGRYRSVLNRAHEQLIDAPRDKLFFVPTSERVALSSLTINSPNRAKGHDYRPVPCQVFDWAMDHISEDLSPFTFVDYGAGKGRAMLLASERPFSAVGGVEFAAELHDNAQMNIAQYPRSNMRCRNVECVLEDAVEVGPPEGPTVHFFFNPFSREVFAEVLNNIVQAYRAKPRRLYLILIDPIATDLVDKSGVFTRIEPLKYDALKIQYLSTHTISVYRSLA